MIVEIDIGADLEPAWRERIDRQINFKFASAGTNVRLLNVRLELKDEQGSSVYMCLMEARLKNGGRKSVVTQGMHPNMCIADAAARLARSISRDRVLATARQASR